MSGTKSRRKAITQNKTDLWGNVTSPVLVFIYYTYTDSPAQGHVLRDLDRTAAAAAALSINRLQQLFRAAAGKLEQILESCVCLVMQLDQEKKSQD